MSSYFDKFNSGSGIPFMDGRNKQPLSILVGERVHVQDFDFLRGDDGDYAVFVVAEFPSSFFFGNKIITDVLHQIAADGMSDELARVSMVCKEKVSKKGRMYIAVEFVEDNLPF